MTNQSQHNNFIISIAGPNIDLSIINIEEMSAYCKNHSKLANVVTEKKAYETLEKLNYALVGNYKNAKPRIINSKNRQYLKVYSSLADNYKQGLLIAEDDTMSDAVCDILCGDSWVQNDVDIMLCRNSFSMISKKELSRASYIRISADPDFDPTLFMNDNNIFQEKSLSLMVSQFFVNDQYDTVKRYLKRQNDYYISQGMEDYIDYYEMNKQLAYFIYYDVKADKIINLNSETLTAFLKKLSQQGLLPLSEKQIIDFTEHITLS